MVDYDAGAAVVGCHQWSQEGCRVEGAECTQQKPAAAAAAAAAPLVASSFEQSHQQEQEHRAQVVDSSGRKDGTGQQVIRIGSRGIISRNYVVPPSPPACRQPQPGLEQHRQDSSPAAWRQPYAPSRSILELVEEAASVAQAVSPAEKTSRASTVQSLMSARLMSARMARPAVGVVS